MENLIYYLPAIAVLGLLFTFWRSAWIKRKEAGSKKMGSIAHNIHQGAMAFLKSEYKILSIFVLAVAGLLIFKGVNESQSNGYVALSFFVGAISSEIGRAHV